MASSGKGKAPAKGKEHDENEAPKLNLDRVLSEKEMLAKDLESKTAELAKSQAQVAAMERLLLEVAVGMHQQGKKHAKHVDVDEVMEKIAEIKSSTHGSSIPGKFKPPKNLPAEDIVSAACRLFLAAESKRDAMLADAEAEKEAILAEKGAILADAETLRADAQALSLDTGTKQLAKEQWDAMDMDELWEWLIQPPVLSSAEREALWHELRPHSRPVDGLGAWQFCLLFPLRMKYTVALQNHLARAQMVLGFGAVRLHSQSWNQRLARLSTGEQGMVNALTATVGFTRPGAPSQLDKLLLNQCYDSILQYAKVRRGDPTSSSGPKTLCWAMDECWIGHLLEKSKEVTPTEQSLPLCARESSGVPLVMHAAPGVEDLVALSLTDLTAGGGTMSDKVKSVHQWAKKNLDRFLHEERMLSETLAARRFTRVVLQAWMAAADEKTHKAFIRGVLLRMDARDFSDLE